MHSRIGRLVALVFAFGVGSAAAADYTFTVEPGYPPDQAANVYQPLLDYLGKATGHHFSLVVASNYHLYWRGLREAKPTDFSFEDAPFTDYRIQHAGAIPLARRASPTRYTLIASAEVAERGIKALVGYRVISMPSPSLGYLLLGEVYSGQVVQPEVLSVAATWRDGVEMIFAGESEAAMVPDHIAELYPNLTVMQTSRDIPGTAVSVGKHVPAAVRDQVRAALLKLHEDPAAYEVLVELGVDRFVPATVEEYAGSERMLKGTFGYKSR